jgi:uncharacterized protein YegP (UPF0339 family)
MPAKLIGYRIWKAKSDGQWYWDYRATSGELISGADGHNNKEDCLRSVRLLRDSAKDKIWGLTPGD